MENIITCIKFLVISLLISKIESTSNNNEFQAPNCTNPPESSCCNFLNQQDLSFINPSANPDFSKNTPELLTKYGIPFEKHTVTTMNGYQITMFRIPGNINVTNGPVILVTGLLAASEDWFVKDLSTGKTIVQHLINANYDVWIVCPRGTEFSRGNTNPALNANNSLGPYWKFSWHEMATEDIPKLVDFICQQTGYKSIGYIGISMGGTQFYVSAATNENFNKQISVAILYAPAGYMTNIKGALGAAANLGGDAVNAINLGVGDGELSLDKLKIGDYTAQHNILGPSCSTPFGGFVCANVAFAIMGFNVRNTNCSQLGFAVAHLPNPASIKQIFHYAQEVKSGLFAPWDTRIIPLNGVPLGAPPVPYDLTQIKAKFFIYFGGNDYLADEPDVRKMIAKLGELNVTAFLGSTYFPEYMHVDYLTGIDAPEKVYVPTIATLNANKPVKNVP